MNILIDAVCQVPAYLMPSITRLASRMRRTGVAPIATLGGTLYLHRRPSGLFHVTTDAEPGAYETKQADYSWGKDFWDDIHRSAWVLEGEDEIETFLLFIELALPCGKCKQHFIKMRQEMPVDYSRYFETGWAWHNAVSASIGKPEMDIEEARVLYAAKESASV